MKPTTSALVLGTRYTSTPA